MTRSFLLPPRVDGPFGYLSVLLGGAGGVVFLALYRRVCVHSNWLLFGGIVAMLLAGPVFARIPCLARVDLSLRTVRSWKLWRFGTPDTVDLSGAVAVEVASRSPPIPSLSRRYWLEIAFSDGSARIVGPWLAAFDGRATRNRFARLAEAVREQISSGAAPVTGGL